MRELCGYNGMEMATRLHWTPTMLSRVESGKRPLTAMEVVNYTAICGVTGEAQRAFLDMVEEPDEYRIKPRAGMIPDELQTLIFLESSASTIDMFEPIFIPGITQTPEYARALITETGLLDPTYIEQRVEIRMNRRSVLTRIDPAQCSIFVHENALRTMVGGPKVMQEQILQLIFAGGRPQCSVRVIPASGGARGTAFGSFQIFGYHEDTSVIYLEHETTSDFLESKEDLAAYRSVLKRLATVALPEAHSREMLVNLASQYERQGVAEHEVAQE